MVQLNREDFILMYNFLVSLDFWRVSGLLIDFQISSENDQES